MPAGYQEEQGGPDAGYQGVTNWFMALFYKRTGNRLMLECVRQAYHFMNHTVGIEPDGRIRGGSNFCHRTIGDANSEFFTGARGILDDVLPEVAA